MKSNWSRRLNLTWHVLVAITVLTGCAAVAPPEASRLAISTIPSSAVAIDRAQFRSIDGELKLEVYVSRQWRAPTTANSHIEITYLDARGARLGAETAQFYPRNLTEGPRQVNNWGYLRASAVSPPGTRIVEVRAVDGQ